jgi:hypothetical protein
MVDPPKVLIMMGSDTDLPVMQEAADILTQFGVPYEIRISSAHRSPVRTMALASEAAGRGVRIIIAGAGMAAHLAGVVAAKTTLCGCSLFHGADAGRHSGGNHGYWQCRGKERRDLCRPDSGFERCPPGCGARSVPPRDGPGG